MLESLGHEPTALGVARLYGGVVERFVLDAADEDLTGAVESELGLATSVLPTVMRTENDRASLARALLALA
jgi:LPPG:FO 2-phospho-L-lactate transferase